MTLTIPPASSSQSVYIRVYKDSGYANTTPLAYNASGLSVSYHRDNGTAVAITLVSLASATAAYASGGWVHVGNGEYRLDVPDAAWANGATRVSIVVAEATDIRAEPCVVTLDATVASRSTYAGTDTPGTTSLLTKLPNVAASQASVDSLTSQLGTNLTNLFTAIGQVPGLVWAYTGGRLLSAFGFTVAPTAAQNAAAALAALNADTVAGGLHADVLAVGATAEAARVAAVGAQEAGGDFSPGGFAQTFLIRNSVSLDGIPSAVIQYSQAGILKARATTASDGTAATGLPAGTYARTIVADGFNPIADTVSVSGEASQTIGLAVLVTTGNPVNVAPGFAN